MRMTVVLLWLSLLTWCAAAVLPGAAAVAAFGTLPRVGLSVPRLDAMLASDPERAGRYAAGRMLQPLFDATDSVQMLAAAVAVTTLLRVWRLRGFASPRWLGTGAVCLVLVAGGVLAVRLSLATTLRGNLHAYWSALESGDAPAASAAKESFDADHRVAERLSSLGVTALLAGIAATAAALAPAAGRVAAAKGMHSDMVRAP